MSYLIIHSYFLFFSLSLTHLGYETTNFSTQAQSIFTVQFSSNLKPTYMENIIAILSSSILNNLELKATYWFCISTSCTIMIFNYVE